MTIQFAHVRARATSGVEVNFAVFDAKPSVNTSSGRNNLLQQLTRAARGNNLKVEASGLVYSENGQTRSWGDHFVVDYLSKNGIPGMTHTLSL